MHFHLSLIIPSISSIHESLLCSIICSDFSLLNEKHFLYFIFHPTRFSQRETHHHSCCRTPNRHIVTCSVSCLTLSFFILTQFSVFSLWGKIFSPTCWQSALRWSVRAAPDESPQTWWHLTLLRLSPSGAQTSAAARWQGRGPSPLPLPLRNRNLLH